MRTQKSKVPTLQEFSSMANKLLTSITDGVKDIIEDYKKNRINVPIKHIKKKPLAKGAKTKHAVTSRAKTSVTSKTKPAAALKAKTSRTKISTASKAKTSKTKISAVPRTKVSTDHTIQH